MHCLIFDAGVARGLDRTARIEPRISWCTETLRKPPNVGARIANLCSSLTDNGWLVCSLRNTASSRQPDTLPLPCGKLRNISGSHHGATAQNTHGLKQHALRRSVRQLRSAPRCIKLQGETNRCHEHY
jgi:hypothetical protein